MHLVNGFVENVCRGVGSNFSGPKQPSICILHSRSSCLRLQPVDADGEAAVHAVTNRSCRDTHLMHCLFFIEAWFDYFG